MTDKNTPKADEPDTTMYEIRVQGHLSPLWMDSFQDLAITLDDDGTTRLTGSIVDQAALHGTLKKIRDLGIELIAVERISSNQNDDSDHQD